MRRGSPCRHKVPAGLDRKETEIYRQLDPERLPRHIAIIMDGNGRWAKRRHMPRVAGHRAGVAAVRSTVETAARIGIHALTLYAFSEENWKKRPKSEVDFLMRLLSRYLKAEVPTLNENNIRLEYIGRQHELPEDVQERMAWARESTAHNTGTVLTLALNYSARSELVDAFRSMVNAASQNGGLEHLRIDEDTVARSSLYAGFAGSGSGGAHFGRDAAEQLPAVAAGLCGDLCDANLVARFPRRASAGRHCRVPEARAALRRVEPSRLSVPIERSRLNHGDANAHSEAAKITKQPPRMLKRIATAVVLIPIVMLLVLRAPVPVVAVVAAAVALITVQEFLKLTESYGVQPLRLPTYVFVGLFFLLLAASAAGEAPQLSALKFVLGAGFAAAIAPFIFLTITMRRAQMSSAYPAAAASAFAFAYIALPMAMLVQLRQQWAGAFWLLYLLLVVWAGDIFAYFVGRSLGRHLMAPRISPKKTWEGAAASLAASLVVGILLFNHALQISSFLLQPETDRAPRRPVRLEKPEMWPIILLTVALNVAAQLGDLVESLIKRGAGVKDSGTILPGHGGMLDRIDALLFAAPVLWFYVTWRAMQ